MCPANPAAQPDTRLRLPDLDAVRILLVDDDPQAVALIGIALADAPFERDVEVAATATAGLERIHADQHDVYVVDQHLPDGTGIDIIRRAKGAGITKPFILLTGWGSGAIDEEASREGAADYVEKHLVAAHLERSIRYALRNWQSSRLLQWREQQLREAQKMEAIGRLSGAIAHHFNNLLTAIVGYAELIGERCTPGDPTSHDVAEIRDAADRAARLTRQLLAFSRKQFLNATVVNLSETADALIQMLPGIVGDRITTRTHLAADLAHVKADAAQVEQVLLNLVLNAREAMPDGGELAIETANVVLTPERLAAENLAIQPGSYVMFCVSDTGVGMDAETRARAFEPFFTTKPKGQASGLGLATAYGIVDQSGGGISIQSSPGKGTTIRVYLPITQAADTPHRGEVPVASGRGGETVLVVDDDDGVREISVAVLRARGYVVYEAATAEAALEWAQTSGIVPQLVVTDISMPGVSGPELAAQLFRMYPSLRVLYMSGYSDEPELVEGATTGTTALLQKPFTPAVLGERVRLLLDTPTAA